MQLSDLKRIMQSRFTDGLVTIVGSGLSAAVGLPAMWALGEHLIAHVPSRLAPGQESEWAGVAGRLSAGEDLEAALVDLPTTSPIINVIVDLTAGMILEAEQRAMMNLLNGDSDFALKRLLRHMTFSDGSAQFITTNYDRLIELAAEASDIDVDTGFCGSYFGKHDPKRTRDSLSSWTATSTKRNASLKRNLRKHVAVHKPHGSVDWYLYDGQPVRSAVPTGTERLMITPGGSKYRKGYDEPFDYHRSAANKAIDSAAGFLVIGYGFNDDQLETHLRQQLAAGKPCLLLTKGLTANATQVVSQHRSVIALTEYEAGGERGTTCHIDGAEYRYAHQRLWNLSDFIRRVLE